MTQVWKRLFIGGFSDAEALARMNPRGVTTVITLSEKRVKSFAAGVNYLYYPLKRSGPIAAARFDLVIDSIAENIRWGSVLIHCRAGRNRSPIIAAAWMDVVGWKDIAGGLEEIRRLCPIVPGRSLVTCVKKLL